MERLILCGGGHVSLALAHMAAPLDFALHVIDDRPEFANTERFPSAEVYAQDFESALETLGGRPDDFFCILTRGHAFDTVCAASILRRPFAYVGMIGSKGKAAKCRDDLAAMGLDRALIDRLRSPIGLPLGGRTPAEIAVSIAAQLVQERAALRRALPAPPPDLPGVAVTVTAKRGSAPCAPGAWMVVAPDGSITGTIGGGALEHRAAAVAMELLSGGTERAERTFDLSEGELGMVCGGAVTVEFRRQL